MAKSKKPALAGLVKCCCCGREMKSDPDEFCSGCKSFICSDCSASAPLGSHRPWQHAPCDVCGESVAEQNLHLCETHLTGED